MATPLVGLLMPRLPLRALKAEDFRGLCCGPVRMRSLRGDGRGLVEGRFEGKGSSEVRRAPSLLLDGLGGSGNSDRVRGREESLELVSVVLTLYVRTLGEEV